MRPRGEERGQAVQIGAVLLFGFLVLALSGYQAVTVPQQNERVELNHLDRVEGDVVELRNDLLEAASTGRSRTVAVELGTTYPARVFGVNPPPPSGSLRSRTLGGGEYVLDATGVNLEDVCGTERDGDSTYNVSSSALVYAPAYSEVQSPPEVVYENSVVYRAFPSANRLDTGQTLIDGKTISLAPLSTGYSETGSDTVSLEFVTAETGVGTTDATSVTLTVPTALTASEWETLLAEERQTEGGQVTGVRDVPGGVEIDLATAEYVVTCAVTGVGGAPKANPSEVLGEGGGGDINPADGGAVKLVDTARDPANADRLVLTFENAGETVNLSEGRFSFYFEDNGDGPSTVDVANNSTATTLLNDLAVGGASKEPATRQSFSGGGNETAIRLAFDDAAFKPKDGDFVVFRLAFEDGDRSNYFVDVPAQAGGGGGGGGGGGAPTPTPGPTPTPTPGGGTNAAPSVAIDGITPNEAGRSGNVRTVDVSFTPDDTDGNLDNATVVVRIDGVEQGRKEGVDLAGREGQSVGVNVDNTDAKGTVEVTVEVFDIGGKSASDTKNENQA